MLYDKTCLLVYFSLRPEVSRVNQTSHTFLKNFDFASLHPSRRDSSNACTSVLCLSVTMVLRGSFSQVELALASPSELGCSVRWMQRSDANLPERRPGRWGQGITPAVMKRCIWVERVLVAQVKFTERTSDNQLRQPVFLGLRTDKNQRKSYVN